MSSSLDRIKITYTYNQQIYQVKHTIKKLDRKLKEFNDFLDKLIEKKFEEIADLKKITLELDHR